MKRIWTTVKKYFFPLLLVLIVVLLAYANYTPNTFLSGWDTLHPEFNFPLAFQRMISGVWRADQGLGAVAIQSHMADLPRVIFLWFESWIFPQSFVRYSYFFLMLIAGPLGMYFLTKKIIGKKTASPAAFLSGLTYLTNLGTVQHFIVPLEMFATHYGFLPWILFTTWNALENWSKKSLLLFAVIMVLATPQAHTATLFYTFLAVWFACLCTYALLKGTTFKKILTLAGVTLCINAFWLLPNIYAVATHGKEVQQSKINRLFTPEAIAKNQKFGNLTNAPILKSFLFDWQLFNTKTNQFEEVTASWQKHLTNPIMQSFGYLVFGISVLGIAKTMRQRNKVGIAMLPLFIIPLLFILNGIWPINQLMESLGRISPVGLEALRFPFTKFSVLFMLALSFYFAQGIAVFKSASKYIVIIFSILFIWYFLPAFQGNLIYPAMRVTIPKDYFEMFQWFGTQPHDQRVALLPIHTFWGWTYYDWGYQGAGFLQFGIPQPIMDRDYNRWSKFNEQYQREMSYAVYSQNPKIIADVLSKYNIQWILLDQSVISPGNTESSVLTWHIPALLTQTGIVTLSKNFGNDLFVYWVTPTKPTTTTILPDVTADDHFVGKTLIPPVLTRAGRLYQTSNTSIPDSIPMPDLPHDQAYVVAIESKNIQGFPLQLCISNNLTSHCDLFTHLNKNPELHTEQFLLPPLSDYGTGYTINFNNFAISGQTTVNEIESVTVSRAEWAHQLTPPTQNAISNDQAYEPGWIAWDGKDILPHVLVNGWENGWTLKQINKSANDKSTNAVTIFFWPQLLEWIGFILLPLPFLAAIGYDTHAWRKLLLQPKRSLLLRRLHPHQRKARK